MARFVDSDGDIFETINSDSQLGIDYTVAGISWTQAVGQTTQKTTKILFNANEIGEIISLLEGLKEELYLKGR